MGSFPLRNLLEKAKDDGERLSLEIIFMMFNVAMVGHVRVRTREGGALRLIEPRQPSMSLTATRFSHSPTSIH